MKPAEEPPTWSQLTNRSVRDPGAGRKWRHGQQEAVDFIWKISWTTSFSLSGNTGEQCQTWREAEKFPSVMREPWGTAARKALLGMHSPWKGLENLWWHYHLKAKPKKANLLGFRDPTWNDTSASRPCQSPAPCLWGLKAEERNNACPSHLLTWGPMDLLDITSNDPTLN